MIKVFVLILCQSRNKYKSLQDNSMLICKKAKDYVTIINSMRCLEKCLNTLWWTLRLSITFQYHVSFNGFIHFGFFVMTNASSFHSTHIYQLLFYSQGFSYYVCAYNVIFSFKLEMQSKILSLALISRWLIKFSFKTTNEKRRVITIYIFSCIISFICLNIIPVTLEAHA